MFKNIKKHMQLYLFIIILFITSSGVFAADRLINSPTAEMAGKSGFLAGEVDYNQNYLFRGMYNLSPWLGVGARYDGYNPELMAKMLFVSEGNNSPAVAAGMEADDLYFVFSKGIAFGLSGHVGYGSGSMEGPFFGLDKRINPISFSDGNGLSLPPTSIRGEYINNQINLGVEMRILSGLNINFAVEDFNSVRGGVNMKF